MLSNPTQNETDSRQIPHRAGLFCVSGPSGVGKGTVCDRIVSLSGGEIVFSVSVTTRKPRQGEIDGEDYFFINHGQFTELIEQDELLEYDEHFHNYYGTPRKFVEQTLSQGKDVLCEIEVNGALAIKSRFPEAVLIFILPPDLEELRKRLAGRHSETEEQIDLRMQRAYLEMSKSNQYDFTVVNDNLDDCVQQIMTIIKEHRQI